MIPAQCRQLDRKSGRLSLVADCGEDALRQLRQALSLAHDSQDDLALTVGSMDEPQSVTPTHHYGIEGRLAWMDIGNDLPGKRTRESR
jgi:hypothetical protein